MLLVDDAALARKMVARTLSSLYRQCDHARNGLEGLEKVKESMRDEQTPYELVITDFYMPVMNGPEAVNAMRGLGFKGVIIGVTGSVSQEDIDMMLSKGADRVLMKPLDMKSLKKFLFSCPAMV